MSYHWGEKSQKGIKYKAYLWKNGNPEKNCFRIYLYCSDPGLILNVQMDESLYDTKETSVITNNLLSLMVPILMYMRTLIHCYSHIVNNVTFERRKYNI